MDTYDCIENLDYYYIESGLHFRFPQLTDGGGYVVFMFCNVCHPDITNIVKNLVYESLNSTEDTRFVFIHLDAFYGYQDSLANIDLLEYESEVFLALDELYSITIHLECFHIDHFSVLHLLSTVGIDSTIFTSPTRCVYYSGFLSEQLSIL